MSESTVTKSLVVVGVGGFGREVLDVVDAINYAANTPIWHVVGVADDAPTAQNLERLAKREVAFLGPLDDLESGLAFSVGIGSPKVRRKIAEELEGRGLSPATLVHPTASHGFDVDIGPGAVLCAGVRLTTNVRIGRHVHINLNTTVGHDTVIGDYVSLNPLASISGDCIIEDGVLVGVAGVVLNGLCVGKDATVGGSACVIRDVPGGMVVKGVPAR